MTRRTAYPLNGSRYCGNKRKKEVHDLDKETIYCRINSFIYAGLLRTFDPDTLEQAHRERYDDCAYCIRNSRH